MEAVVDVKYRPALFLNGGGAGAAVSSASKKTRPAWGAGEAGVYVYRECLKNHAASMGGHALDGCGEFMPSPEADPADPASLRCAACGCHRNFHRRLPEAPPSPPLLALPPPPPPLQLQQPAQTPAPPVAAHGMRDAPAMRGEETPEDRVPAAYDEETDEESDESSDFEEDRPSSPLPAPAIGPPSGYLHPAMAPHMLLALSTGAAGGASTTPAAAAPRPPSSLTPLPAAGAAAAAAAAVMAKKRVRTRFSPEQKQRMQALSERLGWRLQKRDEAVVEESCREIGVTKGVFKVWMHNNKHNFVGGHSARRSASAAATGAGAGILPTTHAAAVHPYPHTASTGAGAAILPSPHAASVHPFPSPHTAAVHPPAYAAPAAPPAAPAPAPPPAPVHADFNINGTAADYFRVQPATATASGGSPQSS